MIDVDGVVGESQLRQSFAMEEYAPVLPSNYDVTVPITSRGNYRNSIEVFNLMEMEESAKSEDADRLRFPDLMAKQVTKSTETFASNRSIRQCREYSVLGRFSLETDAKKYLGLEVGIGDAEKKTMRALVMFKCKQFSAEEFEAAKKRYIAKKYRRKMTYQIRYKVRQDLAVKRQRNKGKFVKSKKMDIRMAVGLLLKQEEDSKRNGTSEK